MFWRSTSVELFINPILHIWPIGLIRLNQKRLQVEFHVLYFSEYTSLRHLTGLNCFLFLKDSVVLFILIVGPLIIILAPLIAKAVGETEFVQFS